MATEDGGSERIDENNVERALTRLEECEPDGADDDANNALAASIPTLRIDSVPTRGRSAANVADEVGETVDVATTEARETDGDDERTVDVTTTEARETGGDDERSVGVATTEARETDGDDERSREQGEAAESSRINPVIDDAIDISASVVEAPADEVTEAIDESRRATKEEPLPVVEEIAEMPIDNTSEERTGEPVLDTTLPLQSRVPDATDNVANRSGAHFFNDAVDFSGTPTHALSPAMSRTDKFRLTGDLHKPRTFKNEMDDPSMAARLVQGREAPRIAPQRVRIRQRGNDGSPVSGSASAGVLRRPAYMTRISQHAAAPKFTMPGRRAIGGILPPKPDGAPGPGSYTCGLVLSKHKAEPSVSFAKERRQGIVPDSPLQRPGPTEYNPRPVLLTEPKAVIGAAGIGKQRGEDIAENPGPGTYEKKSTLAGPSTFLAGRRRPDFRKSASMPGPTQYTPFPRHTSSTANRGAHFGTSTRGDAPTRARELSQPGPGAYNMQNFRKTGSEAPAIALRSRRLPACISHDITPGPGSYNTAMTSFGC